MRTQNSVFLSILITVLLMTAPATAFAAYYTAHLAEGPEAEHAPAERLFAEMPDQFYFLSGAGGWSTELNLADDGTFTGFYHDSDMGVDNPQAYPNGTVYVCAFSGSFTKPERVDGFTYSVHVQSLEYDPPETETFEDGVRYITATPYGLDHADEVLIYLPGYPVKDLPEDFLFWMGSAEAFWDPDVQPETLPFYALNNVNEQQGFFSEVPQR